MKFGFLLNLAGLEGNLRGLVKIKAAFIYGQLIE